MPKGVCHKCNAIISSLNQLSTAPVLVFQIMHVLLGLTSCLRIVISFAAAIGSIPEVPAESCNEVKTSEKGRDGKYWLLSVISGTPVYAYCNMTTGG